MRILILILLSLASPAWADSYGWDTSPNGQAMDNWRQQNEMNQMRMDQQRQQNEINQMRQEQQQQQQRMDQDMQRERMMRSGNGHQNSPADSLYR